MRQTGVSSTHYFHGNDVGKLQADEVSRFFKLTKALPYLPPERIIETYHTLYAQLTETGAHQLASRIVEKGTEHDSPVEKRDRARLVGRKRDRARLAGRKGF